MPKFHGKCGKSVLLSAGIFTQFDSKKVHDKIPTDEQDDKSSEGWKRLKAMYSYDVKGSISPELSLVSSGSFMSFFVGFLIGGFEDSKQTFFNFIEQNRTTKFLNQYDANRSLQDKILLSVFSGGFKIGWRLCFFTTSFLTTVVSISTYMGNTAFWNFIVGGSVSSVTYKFKQGPKAMISGAVIGGAFGAVTGGTILGMLKIAGISFEDIIKGDAQIIEKHHEDKESLLDSYRATYQHLNIGEFYRRGVMLTTDDTLAVSGSTPSSDDSQEEKRHPDQTPQNCRSE